MGVSAVRLDALGRFWVLAGDDPPRVFSVEGKFLALVGRSGRGPGEYLRAIDMAVVPGDSTVVLDAVLRRATVLDSRLKYAREVSLPGALSPVTIVSWPDSILAGGNLASESGVGWPLHLVSMGYSVARVHRSFGPGDGDLLPGGFGQLRLKLGGTAGGVWAVDETRYRVTHFSADGKRQRVLYRNPSWFSGEVPWGIGSPSDPPPPAVSAISEDGTGLVWLFIRVPKATWKLGWPSRRKTEYSVEEISLHRMFRTAVEVIDPKSSRLVSRSFVDAWVIDALPGGRVAVYAGNDDGSPRIEIWRYSVTR